MRYIVHSMTAANLIIWSYLPSVNQIIGSPSITRYCQVTRLKGGGHLIISTSLRYRRRNTYIKPDVNFKTGNSTWVSRGNNFKSIGQASVRETWMEIKFLNCTYFRLFLASSILKSKDLTHLGRTIKSKCHPTHYQVYLVSGILLSYIQDSVLTSQTFTFTTL